MRKLYSFYWDCGRMGDIEGLFTADEEEVAEAIGSHLRFGEILGKHSDVQGTLDEGDIKMVSEDQDLISKLEAVFPRDEKKPWDPETSTLTISGYDPIYRYACQKMEDEDEDD